MKLETRLIVNADDFGYGEAFNRGIREAAEAGAITSTTVLIDGPARDRRILEYPDLSIGLHLDLDPRRDPAGSISDQIARFVDWAGQPPSHFDSHHHRHSETWARAAVAAAARAWNVPVRSCGSDDRNYWRTAGLLTPDNCFGRDDPEDPDLAGLVDRALANLPPGVTEWFVHPGYPDPRHRSRYNSARAEDLALLCSPKLDAWLVTRGIRRITYRDL